jgi:ABC-2 type transport system ATP-binding protein
VSIIETHDLTKEFNGLVAVDSINFSVEKGEIFGFLGPNGAGKSTAINMLTTLLLPTGGRAIVNGFDVAKSPHEVRSTIGIVPQDILLESELTARENLEFQGQVYKVKKEKIEEVIPGLLKMVALEDRENSRVKTFSGGMKRRLEVVKSFLHSPSILFLDEPTQGLDPQSRRVLWDYILKLNKEDGITMFLTTHYMEEADYLCDRIAIIDYGKILDIDTPANLKDKIGEGDLIEIKGEGDIDTLVKALETDCPCTIKEQKDGFLRIMAKKSEEVLPQVLKKSENLNIKITYMSVREPTLEDVFIHYTGREIREQKAGDSDKRIAEGLRK